MARAGLRYGFVAVAMLAACGGGAEETAVANDQAQDSTAPDSSVASGSGAPSAPMAVLVPAPTTMPVPEPTGATGGQGMPADGSGEPSATPAPVAQSPSPAGSTSSPTPAPTQPPAASSPTPASTSPPSSGSIPGDSVSGVSLGQALAVTTITPGGLPSAPVLGPSGAPRFQFGQSNIGGAYSATSLSADSQTLNVPSANIALSASIDAARVAALAGTMTLTVGTESLGLVTSGGPTVNPQAAYALDETIATWRPVDAGAGSVSLLLQSEPANADSFRVCWLSTLPALGNRAALNRLACHVHERASGNFQGIYVVDDSLASTPLTWQAGTHLN